MQQVPPSSVPASDNQESKMSSPGIEANADLMLMEGEAGGTLPYRPLNILRPPFLDSVPPLLTWPDDLCRDVVPEGVGSACMRVGCALSLFVRLRSVFLFLPLSLSLSLSLSVSPSLSCALSRSLSAQDSFTVIASQFRLSSLVDQGSRTISR